MPGAGLCDPHVRVYDDEVYLYATHDSDPRNTGFVTRDWWVWHTVDLVHWKQVSTLRPEQTYWRKPSTACWATDSMRRNGKYYLYFSRGPEEIGVVESDTPHGPWRDPLGKPLIAQGSTPATARDPGILQEEDSTTYIVFGVFEFYIARLNEDMVSLAETPRKLELDRRMGPYGPGKTDDKPYLHKRNGIYYLSWGCYYAMSSTVYGPYLYKDSIIKPDHTAAIFRDRLLSKPQSYNALTLDRHASFFQLHNQWYFICNDQGWPGTQMFFRDSVLNYLRYRDNGELETVELTREGVGRYDARALRLDAANYFAGTNVAIMQSPVGGYEVQGITGTSSLAYPNIRNLAGRGRISLNLSCADPKGCTIEVVADSARHEPLASLHVPHTGGWTSYRTLTAPIKRTAGEDGIKMRFTAGAAESVRLRWFSFT